MSIRTWKTCYKKNISAAENTKVSGMGLGFTLVETMVAVTILSAIVGSVVVVMNNCIETTIDSQSRRHAFEIARENMENILATDSVGQTADFGISELYPEISYETTVEPFYEPATSEMWIHALCSASYEDSKGEAQIIEFEHWLTDLTKQEQEQILSQNMLDNAVADIMSKNPFGNDAEGLEEYRLSLEASGDIAEAARVALQLIDKFPDSAQAQEAQDSVMEYVDAMVGMGEYSNAAKLAIALAEKTPSPERAEEAIEKAQEIIDEAVDKGYYGQALSIVPYFNKIAANPPAGVTPIPEIPPDDTIIWEKQPPGPEPSPELDPTRKPAEEQSGPSPELVQAMLNIGEGFAKGLMGSLFGMSEAEIEIAIEEAKK